MHSSPPVAIIGGSGFNSFLKMPENDRLIASSTTKTCETPYGSPSAAIEMMTLNAGNTLAFLARHGQPHLIPPHLIPYRANLFALKKLGCEHIIAINAVGGIHPDMLTPTQIVIPDQIIDYTYGREHTYYDYSVDKDENSLPHKINPYLGDPIDHIEFGHPLCNELRQRLIKSAEQAKITISTTATYGCTQGPRLESHAEIKKLAKDGCDIVGMTAMPEAALAKELGMSYACLALVVNPAAGCTDQVITMSDIQQAMNKGMQYVMRILKCLTN